MFCWEHVHKTTTFFFFSWTLIQSFKIQLQKKLLTFEEFQQDEISTIKFEAAGLHFLSGLDKKSR